MFISSRLSPICGLHRGTLFFASLPSVSIKLPFHPFANFFVSVVFLGVKFNQGLILGKGVKERNASRWFAAALEREQLPQRPKRLISRGLEALQLGCVFAVDYAETNNVWLPTMSAGNEHDVAGHYAWFCEASELGTHSVIVIITTATF